MYEITDYENRYQPYDKSGRILQRADYVKLPVKPKGDGLQILLEQKRGLEVFAIWCLLLEKATDQKPESRGKLLNFKDESASVEEIAKGISLSKKQKLVEYALSLLVSMGWLKCDITSPKDGTSRPLSLSKEKSNKEKSKVGHFVPPTLQEIQSYIKEKGYQVDAKKFYDYFTEGKWRDSEDKPVRNWKQKIITWSGSRQGGKQEASKICIVCHAEGKIYTVNQMCQKLYLCVKCHSAFKKVKPSGGWSDMSPEAIEKTVLAGKAKR